MNMGKMGKTGPVVLAAGLALALGCGGRNLYSVPAISGFDPAAATAGSTVHITGTWFKDIESVSFNGQPAAAFHVDSQTQITAVLPDNACSGPVELANPAGPDSSAMPFVVIPVITGIDPASGPVGTTLTVTGSGFFDASAVTLGSTAGSATFTYLDPNTITVQVASTAPLGAAAVTLTTTPGQTCTGPVFTVTP